eukprot:CAMPEP_0201485640 /NCGR_PEP_ID=MMETSP0151_2-20130828/9735_1 /ASSEMBLY_ACC=CAM_ASM_000257 /TAXON_ID=200890 /ORGANISM="Paramoeba atlantica, Strain 621/1 / CCAP 1560/9" /LENGTH=77 /DNA_ID=CAMNT_0047869869 /DNA_START=164 /DNA_END=397 /DNA_ORIENTATION=-
MDLEKNGEERENNGQSGQKEKNEEIDERSLVWMEEKKNWEYRQIGQKKEKEKSGVNLGQKQNEQRRPFFLLVGKKVF